MMTRRFNLNFICLTVGIAVITGILTPTAKAVNRSKQTNRILKSASEFDYPPFSLVRPDGSADGFSVDLLKAVTQAVGLEINFIVGPWHTIKQKLVDGDLDVLPLVSYAQEREKVYDFTVPYLRMHGTIFVRKEEKIIRGRSDLKEKEVIVMRGDTAHEYAVRENLSDKLILTDTFEEAMRLLSSGKHDAVIIQQLVGLQLIKKLGISNVINVSTFQETSLKQVDKPLSGFEQKFCIAVQDGNKELLALLNEGLALAIANGTYDELYNKWFSPILPQPPVPLTLILKNLLFILVPILFLLGIVGLWYLRREVAQKTQSLKEEIKYRKQAGEALRASQQFGNKILESSLNGLYIFDLEKQTIVHINSQYTELTGYTLGSLHSLGEQGFIKLFHPDDISSIERHLDELMQAEDGDVIEIEYRFKKAGGDWMWCLSRDTVFERKPDGIPKQLIGTFLDITDRKRAEDALKESEAKYKQIVENVPTAIYEMDIEAFKFTKANDVMCAVLGYSEEELLAIDPMDIFAEDSKKLVIERMKKINAEEEVAPSVECKIITKNGREIWALENSRIIYKNGKPAHAIAVAQDISDRKTLEDQLIRAQKMEAIGTLAGGIAHDFNNILLGIQGYASLMLFELDSTHPHYEPLQNIEKQVRTAARLTAHLLGYARKGKYHVQPIDLNQLVTETSDTFGRTRKEISIHHECTKDLHPIEADRGQMEQVLINLYVNAADAMPGGGKLILKTSNVTHQDLKGKMYHLKPGSYILLTVMDTGTGMDKETQERIFDPFFTTKEMGKGTGLGLASVYGIINGHAGYIDVYSEKGQGTMFQIYLPASDKKVETRTVAKMIDINAGIETILVVEDEEVVLDVGIKMLRKMGYTVLAAKNGEEAIGLYKEKRNTIDMVILDMVMPEMGGGEVYDAMKEINPDVRVLLASGYSIDSQAKQILGRGCNDFVQKPFNLRELSAKIKDILAGK